MTVIGLSVGMSAHDYVCRFQNTLSLKSDIITDLVSLPSKVI